MASWQRGRWTGTRAPRRQKKTRVRVEVPLVSRQSIGSIRGNLLTVDDPSGWQVGDTVIVAVGGESGSGVRGTKGVGGTWPALSYADLATREADTGQAEGTFAWDEDTGLIFRFQSGSWNSNNQGDGQYYTTKAVPRALVADISSIDGNVLTLDTAATVAATDANVYLDNAPIWNAAYTAVGAVDNIDFIIPAGTFAFSERIVMWGTNDGVQGWHFIGAGKDRTTLFSPDGCESFAIWLYQWIGAEISDLHVKGNRGANGFGFAWNNVVSQPVTETSFSQAYGFPFGIYYFGGASTYINGVIRNCKVTDSFQKAAWLETVERSHIYNCDFIATEPLRQYIQWQIGGGSCTECTAEGCSFDGDYLEGGFEWFKGLRVTFNNITSRNGTFSSNGCGATLYSEISLTIEANSSFADEVSGYEAFREFPGININNNIGHDQSVLDMGGEIRNPTIAMAGYINSDNDLVKAIAIQSGCPAISVTGTYPMTETGGLITMPSWLTPGVSINYVDVSVSSPPADIIIDGIRVANTDGSSAAVTDTGRYNITATGTGNIVRNCVADSINATAESNNLTNAAYEAR